MPETIPANFNDVLNKYAIKGFRILALAFKTIKMSYIQSQQITREKAESRMISTEDGMTINELAKMMFWTAHINRRFFALADVAARLEYLMLCGFVSAVNYEVLFPGETALRWRLTK